MDRPSKAIKSTENALWLEHNVRRIITQQEINGVLFNERKARRCIRVLERRQQRLYDKIRPRLTLDVGVPYKVPVNKPFKVNGDFTDAVRKWFDTSDIQQVSGPFTRVTFDEPDLGKRAKLIERLLQLGWVPREFTPKGSPKITVEGEPCPSLASVGSEIGQQIADWYTYRHRQSQIQGWLDNLRPDGRLTAAAFTIGTPTYRFRHKGVVNVPKASKDVLFGWHMRSLFTVPKGKRMVGFDASGLELRMLADAINDKDYTKEVISGDIHSKNQTDAGLPNRDDAKTFIYAFIYGAGNTKIGSIIGGSERQGATIKRRFLESNPRLAECISATRSAAKRGYLFGSDGRKIHLRRDPFTKEVQVHKALNTRLQTAGALVMKWAMVFLDEWIAELGLDAMKVIDMHDEAQWECWPKDAEMVGKLGVLAIIKAGQELELNVPLDGEYKIGYNWAMTH